MVPQAHLVHQMKGRLRIRIPSAKGHETYFSRVRDSFEECPGVETVEVNHRTASVLFLHDSEIASIAKHGHEHELFTLKPSEISRKTFFGNVTYIFRSFDEKIRRFTRGELDFAGLVFAILLISGLYQITRGNVTVPPWYTAFWYALGIITRAHFDTELDQVPEVADD